MRTLHAPKPFERLTTHKYDVLVVGAGLAGITAALKAAESGAHVALLSLGTTASGSSFSQATWGLGCIFDETHAQQFTEEILGCARGMANPLLVRQLVQETPAALAFIAAHGLSVSQPSQETAGQAAYIPCFDTHHRSWNGLHNRDSAPALKAALTKAGVSLFEGYHAETLLTTTSHAIAGIIASHKNISTGECKSLLEAFLAPSVILATGGMAALSFGALSAQDADGSGAALALEAGAALTNIEFLQQMTAYDLDGHSVVFNEKLWAHTQLFSAPASTQKRSELEPLAQGDAAQALQTGLEAHAKHGPYTSARASRAVERALVAAERAGKQVYAAVPHAGEVGAPEFVAAYASWLKATYGVELASPLPVRLVLQASNGGIAIDGDGKTQVEGLFAAGEAAGCYHGADRIGGLASACALVSGVHAGATAAQYAKNVARETHNAPICAQINLMFAAFMQIAGCTQEQQEQLAALLPAFHQVRLQATQALIGEREEQSLASALAAVSHYKSQLQDMVEACSSTKPLARLNLSLSLDLWQCYQTALGLEALLLACRTRKESRGSHGRRDYPVERLAFEHPLLVTLEQGKLYCR
jgi:L-aspartate oxidase